jgi:hypothetical protein
LGAWGYPIGGIAKKRLLLEPAMPLTETAIKKAKPGAKPVKLSDGKGLYLLVSPAGSKLWRWKYRVLGKEKVMALGIYPDVSLAQAREGMDKARKVRQPAATPWSSERLTRWQVGPPLNKSFELWRESGGRTLEARAQRATCRAGDAAL